MDTRHKNRILTCTAVLFLCLVFILLSARETASSFQNTVFCTPDRVSVYYDVTADLFPEYDVAIGNGQVLSYLENGGIAQSMDTQADAMLSEGLAKYWYPQYISTVVIAIDRDVTNTQVSGWKDLTHSEEPIAILSEPLDRQCISLAIAYGLDGEAYTVNTAARLIKSLRKSGLLITKNFDASILVCYDYQAVSLIKSGRNLEIIIPEEGTLSYVYGLLSNTEIVIPDDMDSRLISAGLRLPDGRCDSTFYPNKITYASAVFIPDYAHYNTQDLNSESILRREALGVRLYTTADGREHQMASSLFIALVILWAASVANRAMQKKVKKGAIITAALFVGWMLLRLIKWQINFESVLSRYLWFSYIPFQILITFMLLWLAWGIDKREENAELPLWLCAVAVVSVVSIIMVFTNDLHGLVYVIDLSVPGWLDNYSYGLAYYIILVFFSAQFIIAICMLMARCLRSPRKRGLIFPALLLILFAAYGYGYINRVPIASESDMVMVFAVLSILFFEVSIRSGMIPVNAKYIQLFTNSPIPIQIIDNDGNTAISSVNAIPLDNEMTAHVMSGDEHSLHVDEDTLLFSRAITGGFAVWYEDISKPNLLHRQIMASVKKRESANALLAQNAKIKQEIEEEKARTQLMDGLEAEISEKTSELRSAINQLSKADDKKHDAAVIALSLCYIKRRTDFFFSEQDSSPIGVDGLVVCTEELSEYAALAGTHVLFVNELDGALPAHCAAMFYNFFGEVILHCVQNRYSRILSRLCLENERNTMWLMLPDHSNAFMPGNRLAEVVRVHGGTYNHKDLDDAVGLSLSFPSKGGENDA